MTKAKQKQRAVKKNTVAQQPKEAKDLNTDKQAGPAEQGPQVHIFLMVGIKGSTTGSKVAVESLEAGKALLKDIYVALNTGKPYLNEERGLVYNGSEISHAFLTVEVKKG